MLRSRRTLRGLLGFLVLVVLGGGCKEVSARRNIQEANKLYYEARYDEAIRLYTDALKDVPNLATGWYNLGLAHLALFAPGSKAPDNDAHAQGAIEAFQKYMALSPNDTTARDYLLSTYIDSGHYEGAIKYFEDQLAKNPTDMTAVAQLAQINSQAGRYDEAIRWHRKAAEMSTSPDAKADAWYSIGVLDWRRLNSHPEVAGEERARIADEGIGWLQQADNVRKGHQATLSYINLLYRERALAHDASWARALDSATAQVYYKQAVEIAKPK